MKLLSLAYEVSFPMRILREGRIRMVTIEGIYTPGVGESVNDFDGGCPADGDELEITSCVDENGEDVRLSGYELEIATDKAAVR
jgi:hypothetical protein